MLKDILNTGIVDREKSYCLKHQAGNTRDYFKKHHTQIVFEYVDEAVRIGDIGGKGQAHRVYSSWGKSVNLTANGGGQGGKTGLYLVPIPKELINLVCDKGLLYKVEKCQIETVHGIFHVAVPDGYYLIRKLAVVECERLQTLPDNYTDVGISNTQRYKCLGNGWTVDVIAHILSFIP